MLSMLLQIKQIQCCITVRFAKLAQGSGAPATTSTIQKHLQQGSGQMCDIEYLYVIIAT